ncbi:efflux RND transporter periplasmic adaptor subunit [Ramlibacter sp.]|uniref:efflux RND transporter periplasmic adaptor subunit n=1 Tax=Ramlibacter sp. TaxID=1917967 RepID=UPI003D140C81
MPPDSEPRPSRRTLWLIGLVLLFAAAVVVVVGVASRRSQAARLGERATAQVTRTVSVVSPAAAGESAALDLPARIEAWSRAGIYSRVSGYLKSWKADIGTPVKAGQLLAEIETPELDQQLAQAQAELATARANADLSANTAKRWQELQSSGMVAKQAVDEKLGDLNARQSAVRASTANVERNLAMKQFARIVAPFDGVVTARNTDVGALIGVGGAPGTELFVVSDTRRLRVYVSVPQNVVAQIRPGARAQLRVPERAGRTFGATVASMSNAIGATGSMLVQLTVDNAAGELLPGSFAHVRFALPRAPGTLSIPPSALIFNKGGVRVATVGPGEKVMLKPVTVLRDLGTAVEIASGLDASDRVIESPPDGVENGDVVNVANSAKAAVR